MHYLLPHALTGHLVLVYVTSVGVVMGDVLMLTAHTGWCDEVELMLHPDIDYLPENSNQSPKNSFK